MSGAGEMNRPPDCAVVYLARGQGAGLADAEAFFASYDRCPAGRRHELVVLFKGWDKEPGLAEARLMAARRGARQLDLPDDGLDLGAYFRAAETLESKWLLFLNSHSRIKHDRWLDLLVSAAERPDVGAAACSANWNGVKITTWSDWWMAVKTARIRLLLKSPLTLAGTLFRTAKEPVPVSPHLRTNAFLVKRELWLEFYRQNSWPNSKADCYKLEHGRHGFTRFLEAKGLTALVAGADGRAYEAASWPESGTFCSPGLANLLIHDNQTAAYLAAPPDLRRALEFGCWGRIFTTGPELDFKMILQIWLQTFRRAGRRYLDQARELRRRSRPFHLSGQLK